MSLPPFRSRTIRRLTLLEPAARAAALRRAGGWVEHLRAAEVFLELASDTAGGALSDRQWAAMICGDEAYAGSASFLALQTAIATRLGLPHTIPAHQGRAAEHLLVRHLVRPGTRVAGNLITGTARALIARAQGSFHPLWHPEHPLGQGVQPADPELSLLEACDGPRLLWLSAATETLGGQPVSLEAMRRVRGWASEAGVTVVLDASRLATAAALDPTVREQGAPVAEIMRELAACADLVYMSGRADAGASIGGWIATADEEERDRLRNLCVIHEGMPFYGGMSGRDLAALAIGMAEQDDEAALRARLADVAHVHARLTAAGIPLLGAPGGHGVALDPWGWAGSPTAVQLGLYQVGGLRTACVSEVAGLPAHVELAWPGRTYDRAHLDWAVDTVIATHRAQAALPCLVEGLIPAGLDGRAPRELEPPVSLPPLELAGEPWSRPLPPFKARVVERVPSLSPAEREAALAAAGHNMFLLAADRVGMDCFTDSGTNALSDAAWSAMWRADEVPGDGGAEELAAAIEEVYGYPFALPAHQGRGAEALLMRALITPERPLVVGNGMFITTHGQLVASGGRFLDVTATRELMLDRPWKGDLDLAALDEVLASQAGTIAALHVAVTLNATGGQPVSLANLEAVRERSLRHGVPLYLDATRAVENAWFIQRHEAGQHRRSLAELLRAMADLSDGATVSGKKDLSTHIGGFMATRDRELAARAWQVSSLQVGEPEAGGLAHRDLWAMAQGVREMTDEAAVTHRLRQIQGMGRELLELGLPLIQPIGGHALFLDAGAFLPHLGPEEHPGHALAAALYLAAGIRGMMIRTHGVELLRLCWPRRVHGAAHARALVEALRALWLEREQIPGLALAWEPVAMRATLSRYRPVVRV